MPPTLQEELLNAKAEHELLQNWNGNCSDNEVENEWGNVPCSDDLHELCAHNRARPTPFPRPQIGKYRSECSDRRIEDGLDNWT